MVQSVNDRFKNGTKFLHKSLLSFYAAVVPRFTQPVVIFRRRPVSVGDPLDDLAVYFAVVTVRHNAFDVENDVAGGSCRSFVVVDERGAGQDAFQYRVCLFDIIGRRATLRLANRRSETVGIPYAAHADLGRNRYGMDVGDVVGCQIIDHFASL